MQKHYIQPTLHIHYATSANIIITSGDPDLNFDDGYSDTQDAPLRERDFDWNSYDK